MAAITYNERKQDHKYAYQIKANTPLNTDGHNLPHQYPTAEKRWQPARVTRNFDTFMLD
jgi:hypothetical protein